MKHRCLMSKSSPGHVALAAMLIALVGTAAPGQGNEIERITNDGVTVVKLAPLMISGEKDQFHSVTLMLSRTINGTAPAPFIDFEIRTVVKRTKLNPDLYIDFLIDDEKIFLSSNRRAIKKPIPARRMIGEQIIMRMPIKTYRKLISAKTSLIRIGGIAFALSEEHKSKMTKLLADKDF